jgi:hypothetical protein
VDTKERDIRVGAAGDDDAAGKVVYKGFLNTVGSRVYNGAAAYQHGHADGYQQTDNKRFGAVLLQVAKRKTE